MDIVSDAVLDQLNRTKGWTRFVSVVLWIAVALCSLGGIAMILTMGLAGGASGDLSALGIGAGMGVVMGGVYFLIAFLYAYPAMKLWKFSDGVALLLQDPAEHNLVIALNEQRRLWKFVGIYLIICFSIMVCGILFSVIAGMLGAASM